MNSPRFRGSTATTSTGPSTNAPGSTSAPRPLTATTATPSSTKAGLADALDQLMRRVHSGHATTTEQALLARTAHLPLPEARDEDHRTEAPADNLAQQGNEGNDDCIDDLDDLPDDDVSPAPAAGFGLYNAHEEADKW